MSSLWFRESLAQLMGPIDELLSDVRENAADAHNDRINALLRQAEQQRNTIEQGLHMVEQQRLTLQHTIDELQRELAMAGQPLRGEIS